MAIIKMRYIVDFIVVWSKSMSTISYSIEVIQSKESVAYGHTL